MPRPQWDPRLLHPHVDFGVSDTPSPATDKSDVLNIASIHLVSRAYNLILFRLMFDANLVLGSTCPRPFSFVLNSETDESLLHDHAFGKQS